MRMMIYIHLRESKIASQGVVLRRMSFSNSDLKRVAGLTKMCEAGSTKSKTTAAKQSLRRLKFSGQAVSTSELFVTC